MSKGRTLAGRLGAFAASLLVASLAVFLVVNALPGDVAGTILGSNATPQAVEELREQLGLDRALLVRYVEWLTGMFVGDFGVSAFTREPIGVLIGPRLAVTCWLVFLGMGLAVAVVLPVGKYAALRRKRLSGQVVSVVSQFGMAVPAFLMGITLSLVFAVWLGWLPANGYTPLLSDPLDWARRLVLPCTSLALVQSAVLVRYVRNAFIDVLQEDYFRTARSIGWPLRAAVSRHGTRNAGLQVVTVLGLQLATLFVGAIVIERVFVIPGLGSLLVDSVAKRDLPIVQGVVMLLVTLILVINALVDMLYLLIDPRLKSDTEGVGE
ncbi:MAG: ABC transporter permease [Propionibacteriaceae bacterium]|nr:ABC transporter permease [Propionibacteriaceae bacterium]